MGEGAPQAAEGRVAVMGPGPDWVVTVADETDLDARRQARVDAALRAGWVIRHDPVRGEFSAAREVHVGRTLDEMLGKIESAGERLAAS